MEDSPVPSHVADGEDSKPWSIAEQVVEDRSVKFRLEFSSTQSDIVRAAQTGETVVPGLGNVAGEAPPATDRQLWLRIWNENRNRVLVLEFDRDGLLVASTVEGLAEPARAG